MTNLIIFIAIMYTLLTIVEYHAKEKVRFSVYFLAICVIALLGQCIVELQTIVKLLR